MIKGFEPRLYQQTILASCIARNTLVILPTGLGKTHVFLMLAAHRLKQHPESKILFLGPTKPLVAQYYYTFRKYFEIGEEDMAIFTGQVSPDKRQEQWKASKIIFSTPQGLENDILTKRISLDEVSLLGFDEAHRATGSYSYVWIAGQYKRSREDGRIIALTASPGSDLGKIEEVCKNLFIEGIEVRTEKDQDVSPYIQDVKVEWVHVSLPDTFTEVQRYLTKCYKSKISEISRLGVIQIPEGDLSKKTLLDMQGELRSEIISGNRQVEILKALSLFAEIMKVSHALELLETQGVYPLSEFMEGIVSQARNTKVKAVKNLAQDIEFRSALIKTRALVEAGLEHPKIKELRAIIRQEVQNPDAKVIIFSQFRDSLQKIVEEVSRIEGVKAKLFVGQAKKKGTGMSQKEQISLLKEFEGGSFNVIAMSSVGEEGLDIPAVDLVVFYEPIPSAIRTIQRRGRTGRQQKGRVVVLVAKGTRDEGYRWSAYHKERRMYRVLEEIRQRYPALPKQQNLIDYGQGKDLIVYADYREKASPVLKNLHEKGINIQLKKLDIGDYLLSSRVCVEYKRVPDFVDSIIDKRLLAQVKELRRYEKPVIILEGNEDLFSQRNLHPKAVLGALASIAIGYQVPIIVTKNADETALMLEIMATREQVDETRDFTAHSAKPQTTKEQQEYIISSLPGVGPVLAPPLLKEFGSVKNIICASEEDLKRVPLIGEKKAKKIREVSEANYSG